MTSITGVPPVDELPDPQGDGPLWSGRATTSRGQLGDRLFGGTARGAGVLVTS